MASEQCFRNICFLHTRKNAHVVQTCSRLVAILAVPTTCHQDVFALRVPRLLTSCQRLDDMQLATRLLNSIDLSQVVPTTCYRPTIQQVVIDNLVAT
jgi:hypothetical protein